MPSDVYLINQAITDLREAYNAADVDLLLSVFDEGVIDMSQGQLSGFGPTARERIRVRSKQLFASYSVKMVPIVIDVAVNGSTAYDFGWHELTLTPKAGGASVRQRVRYMAHWRKNAAGQWKISFFIDNDDVKEIFNGKEASWFLSENSAAGSN